MCAREAAVLGCALGFAVGAGLLAGDARGQTREAPPAATLPAAAAPSARATSVPAPPAAAAPQPDAAAAAFAKRLTPAELAARQRTPGAQPIVLDVRSPVEFADGHVPGAINVPHDAVESRLAELERFRDREVVVYCRSGRRAGLAAHALQRHGFRRLAHLEGDMPGWIAAGEPVAKP